MPNQRAKTPSRDVVKDALTPQRIAVLTWAFAAILCGSIGLASVKFARDTQVAEIPAISDKVLPPGGDVATTASIGPQNKSVSIGVMPSVNGRTVTGADQITNSQIETLQREVVALRRRLNALAEQNLSYSRRISTLEEQHSGADTAAANGSNNATGTQPTPTPGIIKAGQPAAKHNQPKAKETPSQRIIQNRIESVPAPETLNDNYKRVQQQLRHSGQAALAAARKVDVPQAAYPPVRIVEAPKTQTDDEQLVTGSINPTATLGSGDQLSKVIEPSEPVGRQSGTGRSLVNHSGFGVIVGRYSSLENAAQAWASFSEQNEERMRDLRPIVSRSDQEDGGYNLLVGPFGNAADAAVACLRLLDVTDSCHPALYVGEPLPETETSRR